MNYFYCPELIKESTGCFLTEEESYHCTRVLRMRTGDRLRITNGKGLICEAELLTPDTRKSLVKIINCQEGKDKRSYYLHMMVAPTKQIERYEWFLEKATELGIDEITPVECEHSERTVIKTERLMKIIISAMKQSGRSYLPRLNGLIRLEEVLKSAIPGTKFIAHCRKPAEQLKALGDQYKPGNNAIVLIGPEGDFSDKEVELALSSGFAEASLGSARFRTETAAIAACCTVHLLNEQKAGR